MRNGLSRKNCVRARASWVLNAWLSGVQGQLEELKLLAGHSV